MCHNLGAKITAHLAILWTFFLQRLAKTSELTLDTTTSFVLKYSISRLAKEPKRQIRSSIHA